MRVTTVCSLTNALMLQERAVSRKPQGRPAPRLATSLTAARRRPRGAKGARRSPLLMAPPLTS